MSSRKLNNGQEIVAKAYKSLASVAGSHWNYSREVLTVGMLGCARRGRFLFSHNMMYEVKIVSGFRHEEESDVCSTGS